MKRFLIISILVSASIFAMERIGLAQTGNSLQQDERRENERVAKAERTLAAVRKELSAIQKELQSEMASGVGYNEGELYNLVREGRGVPAVPLVLIGVAP